MKTSKNISDFGIEYDSLESVLCILIDKINSSGITHQELISASRAFREHNPKGWKQLDDLLREFIGYIN